MASAPSVLSADPETGELRDRRAAAVTAGALAMGTHPDVAEVRRVGGLRVRSGRVAVVDPIAHLHKQPLARQVPPGTHPVTFHLASSGDLGAVVVRFSDVDVDVATVDRATWVWPFAESTRFGVTAGRVALFDYEAVESLPPPRREELATLLAPRANTVGELVALPRTRAWNALVCCPAQAGNDFYAGHWALDRRGALVALVIDFAIFA